MPILASMKPPYLPPYRLGTRYEIWKICTQCSPSETTNRIPQAQALHRVWNFRVSE